MIWQLVKRDPAWQTALVITSVTVLDVARRNRAQYGHFGYRDIHILAYAWSDL